LGKLFDDSYLEKLEYLRVLAKKLLVKKRNLAARIKKTGAGSEFADHRPYTPGDDLRAVDWNVYGRLGRLIVRLFEEDEDLSVYFLLDSSCSMKIGGKFDHARRSAAALAYLALSGSDRVSFYSFSSRLESALPPKTGQAQIFPVMEFLESLEPAGDTDVAAAAKEFVSKTRRRGLVVLVSDMFSAKGVEDAVKFITFNRFELFALHAAAGDDESPVLTGDLALRDSETGEVMLAAVGANTLKAYGEAFAKKRAEMELVFKRHGAALVPAPVRVPFDQLVLAVLKEGFFIGK
jgi:uncharacterized protein (DUF58 family)